MPVGQKLEEARKRKGASLREVSESTKIRGDYLSAIEAGNHEINLPEVYLRGFVRLYAKFLGLDQDAMVSDLDLELGKPGTRSIKKTLGSIVSHDTLESKDNSSVKHGKSTTNQAVASHGTSKVSLPIIFSLVGVFAATVIFVLIYIFSDDSDPSLDSLPSRISEVQNPPTESKDKEKLADSHILSISISGDVQKLIVCDEGMSPPEFHEFDSLSKGWSQEIPFKGSFRCYSTALENLIISVDESAPQKVGGDRQGTGTFSWKPQS